MILVISSPSSSTTGLLTLIFATPALPSETDSQTVRAYCTPGSGYTSGPTEAGPEEKTCGLQVGDVRLLGAYRLGGLLEGGQLAVGQRGLHDPADPVRAQ